MRYSFVCIICNCMHEDNLASIIVQTVGVLMPV
jgi:hypothetical protein